MREGGNEFKSLPPISCILHPPIQRCRARTTHHLSIAGTSITDYRPRSSLDSSRVAPLTHATTALRFVQGLCTRQSAHASSQSTQPAAVHRPHPSPQLPEEWDGATVDAEEDEDQETRRLGDQESAIAAAPYLPLSFSPCLLASPSPCLFHQPPPPIAPPVPAPGSRAVRHATHVHTPAGC